MVDWVLHAEDASTLTVDGACECVSTAVCAVELVVRLLAAGSLEPGLEHRTAACLCDMSGVVRTQPMEASAGRPSGVPLVV